MSSKGYVVLFAAALSLLLVLPGLILIPDPVSGREAEVISHILDPGEPRVDLSLNVTVEFDIFDEPLTTVNIQWCIVEEGGGGLCGPMNAMNVDPSGRNYSYEYPADHFQNLTYEFHIYEFSIDASHPIYAILLHMAKVPEYIVVNATMEPNTIHPNETISVSGELKTDLGEAIEDAKVNISISDLGIFNLATTDTSGIFSLDLKVPNSGYYIVNLTASWESIMGYAEFALTVSEWTLPSITITGTGSNFIPLDHPPGASENTYYENSNITFGYEIGNSGNDEAMNITATVTYLETSSVQTIDAGSLQPGQRYADAIVLNTTAEGHYKVNITAEWDQSAPFPIGFEPPFLSFEYDIDPRPEWTGHTVFVEMFTQTTCAPCVYVEETLEVLHDEGLNFEYVVYVLEDAESGLIAEGLNITTTPVLFVDEGLFRKDSSSNDVRTEIDEVRDLIEDAATLERPPVYMEFLNGDELSITSFLDPEYRDPVSGIIEIYKVESHSNLRNYQGIPMSNRYLGSVSGREVNDLLPGNWFNFSVDAPGNGEGLVAVLIDDDGTVVQTTSYMPEDMPKIYLDTTQVLLTIESSGEESFDLTLDRYSFEEETFEDIDLVLSESGFPMGWSIVYDSGIPDLDGTKMAFTHASDRSQVTDVGRVRYYQDYGITVKVPENESGYFDFQLVVEIGNYSYSTLVVVIVPEPGDPEINITDFYLYGEGKAIFFQVEATGVPDGATVKGRILPCNYGPGASCGIPEDFLMTEASDGVYRASVVGVDLATYTHLTYSAWVEFEDTRFSETDGVQVEISSLVDIESDDDDPPSPWIFIFSITGLIVALGLAVILFILARRSKDADEKEGSQIEEEMGEPYDEQIPPTESGELEVPEEEPIPSTNEVLDEPTPAVEDDPVEENDETSKQEE